MSIYIEAHEPVEPVFPLEDISSSVSVSCSISSRALAATLQQLQLVNL